MLVYFHTPDRRYVESKIPWINQIDSSKLFIKYAVRGEYITRRHRRIKEKFIGKFYQPPETIKRLIFICLKN